jgi:hypothetical protein
MKNGSDVIINELPFPIRRIIIRLSLNFAHNLIVFGHFDWESGRDRDEK